MVVSTSSGPVFVRRWSAEPTARPTATPVSPDTAPVPVLVCLHGITDSGQDFRQLWQSLGRQHTVIAPDLPGHGRTPWSGGRRLELPQFAHSVAAVLDALQSEGGGSDRYVLLGHSLGALTAAQVAALRPELVVGLVIEEPPRRPIRRRWVRTMHRKWAHHLKSLDPEGLLQAADEPTWSPPVLHAWADSKTELDLQVFDVATRWGTSLARLLRAASVPVTIVAGSRQRGSESQDWQLRRLQRACGVGCRVVRLDGGHAPRRDAPEAFATVVREFLDGAA
jgi:pimeloyl-ACP methyl ester carboxylesterase